MRLDGGARLGPYEIISSLAVGGMGEVFRARDVRLDRPVAIKILPERLATDRDAQARFDREARAVAALNHPHICTIHDIGHCNGIDYLVMELVEGETLAARLQRGAVLQTQAVEIARQICDALQCAHEAGIIHRDLKPANIMLTRSGAKLLDFGVATLARQSPDATHTARDTLVGTPGYMSPEQSEGKPLDPRSDVFSLGTVLYEMLSGRRAFGGDSMAQTISAVLRDDPPPLEGSAPLNRVVMRCLAKRTEARFQTMADVQAALAAVSIEPVSARRSIAVLPFVNMSADPENEYFCDGLAEELLNALTKIRELQVVARTSSFSFKGTNADVRRIGQTLNVGTVLEGSARKAGSRVRITVQLVNVADGYHLWSERYDRQMEDIFDVQDEIANAVVSALKVELLGAEGARLLRRYTENTAAYELYLKGRFHLNKYGADDWRRAIAFFEQAIEMEPDYAPAHAALAVGTLFLWYFGLLPSDVAIPASNAAALRALEIDPALADAHLSLAHVHFCYHWNWAHAEQSYRRTLALNPNEAAAHSFYALFLSARGRFDEAIREGRRALELDPLSLFINMNMGWVLWSAGRREDALAQVATMIEIEPGFYGAYWLRGSVHHSDGQYDDAETALKQAIASGGPLMVLSDLGVLYGTSGRRGDALAVLQQLLEIRRRGYVPALYVARVYVALGEHDEAFEWLELAYQERNGELVFLESDTLDAPAGGQRFSDDPRFADLLRRIGLT